MTATPPIHPMRRLLAAAAAIAAITGWGSAPAQRPDMAEALRELGLRADSGDPQALYSLAMLHERGYDSIRPDTALSVSLLRRAAAAGYAPAQSYLGFLFHEGKGIAADSDSAIFWISRAAEQGDAKAASNLGFLLLEGKRLVRDCEEGAYWLGKAADAGLPVAMSQLGDLYRDGTGVERDTARAAALYADAAREGLRDAEWKLIDMMRPRWERLAPDSAARLGIEYYTGGLPKSGVMLMETGSGARSPEAELLLGDAYGKAYGVAYDHDLSLCHYVAAAAYGSDAARRILDELLQTFPDALKAPGVAAVADSLGFTPSSPAPAPGF